tara:strand:- start:1930 stop:2052 length:123 start_codon:yes stop_codon:yes gene_type:complete
MTQTERALRKKHRKIKVIKKARNTVASLFGAKIVNVLQEL